MIRLVGVANSYMNVSTLWRRDTASKLNQLGFATKWIHW